MLHKVKTELKMYKLASQEFGNDPEAFSMLGQILHLMVEQCVKGMLELSGIKYPKIRKVSVLLDIAKNCNCDLSVTDWLVSNAETLDYWGGRGRYESDVFIQKSELQEFEKGVLEFLKLNSVID